MKKKGEWGFQIKSRIGTESGASKNQQGGLKAVNDKTSRVTIWRRHELEGKLCIFDDIEEYIAMTAAIHETIPNFFLAVNYFGVPSWNASRNVSKVCKRGLCCCWCCGRRRQKAYEDKRTSGVMYYVFLKLGSSFKSSRENVVIEIHVQCCAITTLKEFSASNYQKTCSEKILGRLK